MTAEVEDPFAEVQESDDPFANVVSIPAVSFKDAPIGTRVTFVVTAQAKLVQATDFETGKPAVWDDGNPKMAAVIQGEVNGERRNLWATKPSSLFNAIGEAQDAAGGKRIGPGDTLVVTFASEKPNAKNPRLNPQKIYEVQLFH